MKKIVITLLCFMLIYSNAVFAEDSQSISDKMSSIWLSPTENADVLENIYKVNQEKIEEAIALYLIAPGYAREKIGISADDEKMKQQVRESYSVKENEILKVYYMKNTKYAKMYADSTSFRYLISDDYNWFMKVEGIFKPYEIDGSQYDYQKKRLDAYSLYTIDDEAVLFLKNLGMTSSVLGNIDVSSICEIKIVAINTVCTCLYIDCGSEEYLVRIHMGSLREKNDEGFYISQDWVRNLEPYKLYNAKDFMYIISDEADAMNNEKPTYDTEALSLQQDGLLKGNENGLDLLKPLTRIEAATMLLRAMGEGTDVKTQTQTFADVPATHWGYGAAENAYSLGLIKGVGDDLFAPDDMVTATQFAAMVLRAGNHSEFNWENALEIMINEGIISSENAAGMDFFTRGDMAKIIYEAKQRGIF